MQTQRQVKIFITLFQTWPPLSGAKSWTSPTPTSPSVLLVLPLSLTIIFTLPGLPSPCSVFSGGDGTAMAPVSLGLISARELRL